MSVEIVNPEKSYLFPVGISDFIELVTYKNSRGDEYLYIDKTEFIEEIDSDGSKVIVLTRPRRFGKTINLSMLEYFYAPVVDGEPTKGLFDKLEIAKYPHCMEKQGSTPVIFLSLKGVKQNNYEDCIRTLKSLMSDTYKKYRSELLFTRNCWA